MSTIDNSVDKGTQSVPEPNSGFSFLIEIPDSVTHPFECRRCSKRFASRHALGGHNNSHRKEKKAERKLKQRLQRRAKKKQSLKTLSSPTHPLTVQPDAEGVSNYTPMAMVAVAPGFIYTLKQSVFVPSGPNWSGGFKAKEVAFPYEASHQEHRNYPNNDKPLKLNAYYIKGKEEKDEKDLMAALSSRTTDAGPYAAGNLKGTDCNNSKEDAQELDLTLRL